MKTVMLIPDGVGVRNFLIGPFLQEVLDRGETEILHIIAEDKLSIYQTGAGARANWEPLITPRETVRTFFIRNCLVYAQMYWANTRSMRFNLGRPLEGPLRRRIVRLMTKRIGALAASPRGIRMLDRLHCSVVSRSPEVKYYRDLFRRTKPTVLFCSHQRPPDILAPVMAARLEHIPTATFIFSWDNLTSKGRISAPFDHYLVWSDQMRKELLRYYPDVDPAHIHIVGTPQFDPYADRNILWSREEFFRRVNADSSRPLLCYSGGDVRTCPEDPAYVEALMELIRAGKIHGNPQVLVRPSPVDDGTRYVGVRQRFPEMIFAQPAWVRSTAESWAQVVPLPEDVQFLANLTQHADINLNLASTMTLDFALHDKPVVNMALDMAHPPVFGTPVWDFYYQFDHYRPVMELGAARPARSPEELAACLNGYLDDPALDRECRKKLVALEVGYPSGQASRRIVDVLQQISN